MDHRGLSRHDRTTPGPAGSGGACPFPASQHTLDGPVIRFILRRIAIAIPILFAVSIVTFTFANLAPGDPVSAMVRPGSDVAAQ